MVFLDLVRFKERTPVNHPPYADSSIALDLAGCLFEVCFMAGAIWIAGTIRNDCSLSSSERGLYLISTIGPPCSHLCMFSKAAFHFYKFLSPLCQADSCSSSDVSLPMATSAPQKGLPWHPGQATLPFAPGAPGLHFHKTLHSVII